MTCKNSSMGEKKKSALDAPAACPFQEHCLSNFPEVSISHLTGNHLLSLCFLREQCMGSILGITAYSVGYWIFPF